MMVQAGSYRYAWEEDWTSLPVSKGFAHHGLAICPRGEIYSGDGAEALVHVLQPSGDLIRSFPVPVAEVHGLCISTEAGTPILWVTDTGNKNDPKRNRPSRILKCTLEGEILATLERSDFRQTDDTPFALTSCSVDPETGCLWVADGYGASRIHRFNPDLVLELTLDGSESPAGGMKTPHWIWADHRKGHTEIYVADRSNDRILIYAPSGKLLRVLDKGFNRPSGFATFDDVLVVAELSAAIVLLDRDDNCIGRLGAGLPYLQRPGWPNQLDANGQPVSPRESLEPGLFNSPHGVAADDKGNIYVSEWLYGDRHIRLSRK